MTPATALRARSGILGNSGADCFALLPADVFQLLQQWAIGTVIECFTGGGDQFFPVMPFADRVLAMGQSAGKSAVFGSACHTKRVAQLLHFHTIGVKIGLVEVNRLAKAGS